MNIRQINLQTGEVTLRDYTQEELTALAEAEAIRIASIPVPTVAQLQAETLAKARSMRLPIMQVLDGLQASAIVNSSTVLVNDEPVSLALVIEQCKQALRALPQTVDLSAATTKQQMEYIVLLAYKAIVDAAPVEIKTAFDSLKP